MRSDRSFALYWKRKREENVRKLQKNPIIRFRMSKLLYIKKLCEFKLIISILEMSRAVVYDCAHLWLSNMDYFSKFKFIYLWSSVRPMWQEPLWLYFESLYNFEMEFVCGKFLRWLGYFHWIQTHTIGREKQMNVAKSINNVFTWKTSKLGVCMDALRLVCAWHIDITFINFFSL